MRNKGKSGIYTRKKNMVKKKSKQNKNKNRKQENIKHKTEQ